MKDLTTVEKEVFASVIGYDGFYEVSNLGNVRSLDRKLYRSRTKSYSNLKGRILKSGDNPSGYPTVKLCSYGTGSTKKIHRLVAEAWCIQEEGQVEVNHIDGNKNNNAASNLEWCTKSENIQHAYDTGLKVAIKGEDCVRSILNKEIVTKIRNSFDGGDSIATISLNLELTKSTIRNVVTGRSWAHLPTCTRSVDNHHLTAADVKVIRRLHATGEHTQTAIGHMFEVHQGCISSIVRGVTWTNI